MFEQAKRLETDGPMTVSRETYSRPHAILQVTAVHEGVDQVMLLSEYQASRVFAGLAHMLQIPLSKAVAATIKL